MPFYRGFSEREISDVYFFRLGFQLELLGV